MHKHTSGPWRRDIIGHIVNDAGERVFFDSMPCMSATSAEVRAVCKANTDLALAAPELFDALTYLLDQIERTPGPQIGGVLEAQAALSKASGKGE